MRIPLYVNDDASYNPLLPRGVSFASSFTARQAKVEIVRIRASKDLISKGPNSFNRPLVSSP